MFEGPCTRCQYKGDCTAYPELFDSLYINPNFQRGDTLDADDEQLDRISRIWMQTVAANVKLWPHADVIASLPALFDTLCSALYARGAVAEGMRQKPGLRCREELIFPFTWMCPRCVARRRTRSQCYLPGARRETNKGVTRDYAIVEWLAKPGGRFIGDVGFKVLMSILRTILRVSSHTMRLATGGGRRGEFDLTMASDEELVFGEVKAKPLIGFPLILRQYFTDASVDHEWTRDYTLEGRDLALYVAASNFFIQLGPADTTLWPLDSLERLAEDSQQVSKVVSGWRRHLDAYRVWKNEPDELRWHRFGCGNFGDREGTLRIERRVANTKELPGLDRTDDIKKGTSQVLLFSRFKLNCQRSALKSALLSNLYAETHGTDYADPLSRLQVKTPDASRYEWVFDMLLGLSRNVFNDALLEAIFDTEKVIQRVASGETT